MEHKVIFKRSLTGFNSVFFFSSTCCFTQVKKPILLYYLLIPGDRIIGFMPFLRVLALYIYTYNVKYKNGLKSVIRILNII